MGMLTVTPPDDGLHPTITVSGRSYTCVVGQTIQVPDFDAIVMMANGWTVVPYATIVGLQSATTPDTTLTLDPTTGDVFQATGS